MSRRRKNRKKKHARKEHEWEIQIASLPQDERVENLPKRNLFWFASVFALILLAVGVFSLRHQSKEVAIASAGIAETPVSSTPPQFVVLSFDGSRSINFWKASRQFSRDMAVKGIPVKFTYFVSGVYFLSNDNKNVYYGPGKPQGESAIGFATTTADVAARVAQVNGAIAEGHEIGSHANGHFDGTRWSFEDWKSELTSFENILFHIPENNPGMPANERLTLGENDITGFRAPLLGINSELFRSLADMKYSYDASGVSIGHAWPKKDRNGIWEFPLSTIHIERGNGETISMDYSIFEKQSYAQNIAKRGTPLWDQFYQEVHDAYLGYFADHYSTNHAPVFIGNHFSQWNDGLYWQAMQDFAAEVCGKPEVKCVTFRELAKYLNSLPPGTVQTYDAARLK